MCLPILIRTGGALENQVIENEIAHPPLVLPWTNTGLLHRLGEGPDCRAVDHRQVALRQPWTFPPADRGEDPGAAGFPGAAGWSRRQTLPGGNALKMKADLAV